MAVVFISPKRRQRIFFASVGLIFLVLFSLILGWIFISKPSKNQISVEFNKPKVTINFKVLDSDQFKSLQSFTSIQPQFKYTGKDASKKPVVGYIAAETKDDALKALQSKGFSEVEVSEVSEGRDNPYVPYSNP